MFTKSLILGVAALAASTAATLPADAKPNNEVRETVIFWLLDRNGDGQIDKAEVEALRATIFDAVDTDNDGKVSRDEFSEVIGNTGRPRHMRGGPGSRSDGMEQRGDRHDGRRGERMMDRLGFDATDGLNKSDFVGATPKLFERADDDGSGTVSKSEFEQARNIGRLIILE